MTNKIIHFFIFFSLIGITSYGQSNMEDVVYLKNGGVTRGIILEISSEKTIKIQTNDRNIFVYKFSEIEKMAKEKDITKVDYDIQSAYISYNNKVDTVSSPKFKQKGFHNITKIGPMGLAGYSLSCINGYQFNPYLLVGLGIGLDVYKDLGGNNDLIPYYSGTGSRLSDYFFPVFIDVRYHIKGKSKSTFFPFLQMGYSVYLGGRSNDNQDLSPHTQYNYNNHQTVYNSFKPVNGGTFICTGIGFKVFANKNIGVITDIGMKIQNYSVTEFSSSSPGISRQSILIVISPILNLGVTF